MKTWRYILIAFLSVAFAACGSDDNANSSVPVTPPDSIDRTGFVKGADVSWVTQMESEGVKFYNAQGESTECMRLLRDECGVNAIRLRVWVNPAEGWNNIDDVVVKARRANDLGLRLMIDFHYSDTWADPGHQETPAAWRDYNIGELCAAVSSHTCEMMNRLKMYNIEPEWVQIGNETRGGMLYPLGSVDNGNNFARLVTAGHNAVKSVFPQAQTIVHIDKGDQLGLYSYIFSYLAKHNGVCDMIGMSLYPEVDTWETAVNNCVANINTLVKAYHKPVMICEIGMSYDQAAVAKEFIATLKHKCETETNGDCRGIFYWEPQAPAGYNGGYTKGCFDKGSPTIALDAFKE